MTPLILERFNSPMIYQSGNIIADPGHFRKCMFGDWFKHLNAAVFAVTAIQQHHCTNCRSVPSSINIHRVLWVEDV